jgi:hypothetical protein
MSSSRIEIQAAMLLRPQGFVRDELVKKCYIHADGLHSRFRRSARAANHGALSQAAEFLEVPRG